MKKYRGAIVDGEGFIVFEFTTKFCNKPSEARQQAREICEAWRLLKKDNSFQWVEEKKS